MQDLICAEATGSSYSVPAEPAAGDGQRGEAALARVEPRAHLPQRLGDAVDGPAADRLVAVEHPDALGLAREPAGQQPQQRARVADVDRAGRLRGRPQPRAADQQVVGARLDDRAERLHRAQRRARVLGVEVAGDLHRIGGHGGEQRGAVRDRLVGRRGERAAQAGRGGGEERHGRATVKPRPAIRPSASRASLVAGDPQRDRAGRVVGGGIERHVGDVDRGAAERERDLGHDAGPVGDRDAQLDHLAAREVGLEQPPAVVARGVVPGADRGGVAPGQRRADGAEPRHGVVDRGDQRVGVGEVDVAPDRGRGARDARGVAEARAGRGQPLGLERARGLGHEHVGEHVRQVRDRGHQAVVGLGVDRGRARAEVGQQPVEAVVEDALGARGRRQVPGRAVEQAGARVLDAGRLGAGQRVAADEARVVDLPHQLALGRADVGHHARRGGGGERLAHGARQRAHRRGDEGGRRARERLGRRSARGADRAVLERLVEHPRRRVVPADLGAEALTRGEPDGPAHEPDAEDRDDQARTAESALPATAAARSTCSR